MAADRLASALPASPRPLSISPTRPATDFPSSLAISDKACQNSSSSEILVRWRAMVSERLFLGLAMARRRSGLRRNHVLWPDQPVEILRRDMAKPDCLL